MGFRVFVILSLLVSTGAWAGNDSLDRDISYWEERLATQPDDTLSLTRLGSYYLIKARRTGDATLYSKSEIALKKSLSLKADQPEVIALLANVYADSLKFKEARALAEKLTLTSKDNAQGFAVLGDALMELGELDKAEDAYIRYLELQPSLPSLQRLARLKFARGDMPDSIRFYHRAIEDGEANRASQEDLAQCHYELGRMYMVTGSLSKAEEKFRLVKKVLPGFSRVQKNLAELLAMQDKFTEAAEAYEKLAAQFPEPDIFHVLGDIYAKLEKPELSKKWHDQAQDGYLRDVEKGGARYYRNLAFFFADSRPLPAEAVRWARKEMEIRQNAQAFDTMAWALYKVGEFNEAADQMKRALASKVRDGIFYYHAAMICYRVQQTAVGEDFMKRAGMINPNFKKVRGYH